MQNYACKRRIRLIISYDMVNRYVQDNGYGRTIQINFMVKCVCVCMGFGSNGFVTKQSHSLMDGHYMTYIISGMGHPRSKLVVPLILWMVAYKFWGIYNVLQVPRDSANPIENV